MLAHRLMDGNPFPLPPSPWRAYPAPHGGFDAVHRLSPHHSLANIAMHRVSVEGPEAVAAHARTVHAEATEVLRVLKAIVAGSCAVDDFRPAITVLWNAVDDFARAGGAALNS
ncbi:hypothetical protein [Kitasatospora brasiliensis]|uniref:hypothetical protein n=1 Tax=Kitasatospora brasiliensis TaxID=3058040 RepID=UPI00292ED3EB|nr:hypothetical protein [Kitasatospora sp. K002]